MTKVTKMTYDGSTSAPCGWSRAHWPSYALAPPPPCLPAAAASSTPQPLRCPAAHWPSYSAPLDRRAQPTLRRASHTQGRHGTKVGQPV
jgi:hypothetical protein